MNKGADAGKLGEAMGQLGKLTSIKDLPKAAEFKKQIKQTMKLIDDGVKTSMKSTKAPFKVPADLVAALARNAKAKTTFAGFAPSHQREYVEWITEAKRPETREKRLATTLEWLAEGKSRHWKYQKD